MNNKIKHSLKEYNKIIDNYMKKLSLTLEEAEELYAFDYLNAVSAASQTVDKYTELAKKNCKIYEREVKPDSTAKRTRTTAPNETKDLIIKTAETALTHFATILTLVPEKTIDFTFESKTYTLKLTKHNTYVGIKESKAAKRKVNANKAFIINEISNELSKNPSVTNLLIQTETKINFNISDINYTLALTEHRA